MLISGKGKFDVVIANINSPDLHGFKLLQQAVNMGLPTVVTSNDDNTYMAMKALESGAFLYIKKPLTIEILKCLWQHALREKTRIVRERDILMAANNNGVPINGVDIRNVEDPSDLETMMTMNKNKGKMKKNRERDNIERVEQDHQNRRATNTNSNNNVKRKMCTEWTQELHAKFMAAVEELGEGRCFPKEILELMNVPGLTRMQVASHLQKCRNDNWRSPLERKSQQATQPESDDPNGSSHKPRKFGSKPVLKTRSGQSYVPEQGSEIQSGNETLSNGTLATETPPLNGASSYHHLHQHYGPMGPGPGTIRAGSSSANHRHPADEFFSFQEVDCLIQNFSGFPHGSGLHYPNPTPGAYNFASTHHEQNSGELSMESKSHWSSDTSNFESDQSAET
ncbi:Two-component response regulator ARR2 [Striga hermonthica]|uniref:Two-component response regulator ARR2 n=1 Tax=Striga hermonthica TaxID=68872 RepID=A0A9N7RBH8_STRHE|nr:Two-component response regulator ARR2 [Striga hermonthica]